MERIVVQRHFPKAQIPQLKRVAAYARVSSGKDAMLHSLSAQVSYYSELIQNHSGWQYAGVYADEALTGTKDTRDNFQRLLTDCRAGKIDMVITKSISRFARNTVTLLETVRELKSLGVDVYFEEQNLHSISPDGEMMLTILASYAQEESLSASENQKWRIRKNFEAGIPWRGYMYGYRLSDGQYQIVPEEAEVICRIFAEHRDGSGYTAIANRLNEDHIPSPKGLTWSPPVVRKILSNYAYTGNLLLQTTYRENHLTKKLRVNKGELPMYHAEDTHDAIIDLTEFSSVQAEKERRAAHYTNGIKAPNTVYPFSGMLVCAGCGKNYRRKKTAAGPVWICSTFNSKGKAACPSKQIPEPTLMATAAEVLGIDEFDADAFLSRITDVCVENGNRLTFYFADGTRSVKQWKDRSRADSWTDEMKAAARRKALERSGNHG